MEIFDYFPQNVLAACFIMYYTLRLKPDPVVTHLLGLMAVMGIPTQIKTDNAPAHVSTN